MEHIALGLVFLISIWAGFSSAEGRMASKFYEERTKRLEYNCVLMAEKIKLGKN